ncbi:hypothetical protein, partial [Marinovum sp. 1_MG-2023]|uniref:hypothetical protein n=1 Tax=Marinovum sp. 1_MG-2023 TaxID=3062633 RepID=UPI0026E1D4A8
ISLSLLGESDIPELLMGDILALRLQRPRPIIRIMLIIEPFMTIWSVVFGNRPFGAACLSLAV